MLRPTLVITLLVLTALAGCAEDGAPVQDIETTEADRQLKATATTGVIRGVVIDATVTPIAGATIRIAALDVETVSDEVDGSFGFDDLEPGTYMMDVSKIGFGKVKASAAVEAGVDKPAIVRIQLEADALSLPQAITYTFNGYIECSWVAMAVALAMCSVPEIVGIDLGDEFITYIDVESIPTFTQTEMLWDATQAAGDALQLNVFDGTTSGPMGTNGPSPQFLRGDRAFWENGTGGSKSGSPMLADGTQISFRVFAGWLAGTEGPFGWGVGVTLSQQFTMYNTIFTNIVPDEEWTFIEDGEFVVPS